MVCFHIVDRPLGVSSCCRPRGLSLRLSRKSPGRPKIFLAPTGGGLAPKEQAGGSLTIRPMREEDMDAVAACEAASTASAWNRQNFADSLLGGHSCWVMQAADASILGQAVLMGVVDEAHLLIISIHPDWRGHGLGRRLLEHMRWRAREMGAAHLFLEVRESNQVARSLYDSQGFEQIGRRKAYYPAAEGLREDALVMRCAP